MARLICGLLLILMASGVAAADRKQPDRKPRYETPYSNSAVRRVREERRVYDEIVRSQRPGYFKFKPVEKKN